MPISLFTHRDDIEFGLRNVKYRITLLNGVGVRHKGFEYTIDANDCYDTRNTLVELTINKEKGRKRITMQVVLKSLSAATVRLTYKEAHLVYRGILDFLGGPAWLYGQKPEKLNTEIRHMAYQIYSMEDLKKYLTKWEFVLTEKQIREYQRNMGADTMKQGKMPKAKATVWHYLTLNRRILPAKRKRIRVIATSESPFETFREKTVVRCEPQNGKVYFTHKRYKELFRILWLYVKSVVILWRAFGRTAANYQEHIGDITAQAAWEKYLGLS